MSDIMTPLSMEQLLNWTLTEYEQTGTVFSVDKKYEGKYNRKFMTRNLETPVGPAAGPHSQLAQNIVASYLAGARFFELKTVQTLDGRALAECVKKPCILAEDEGYNVEWSTELTVEEAMEEYIKAWVLLSVISKEFALGDMDGFQFNMSVGYDLEGISSKKIDDFIEGLKEARNTKAFQNAISVVKENMGRYKRFKEENLGEISSEICNFVTLSTLHGCPPEEIEKIASYLLTEKKINTYIKCNPTLLGYDFARDTLDAMGYDYIAFGEFHFDDDLQYVDAIPMLKRLMALASEKNLAFGVKITNTFPVDIKNQELPGEEMYMSGKSLYPLSLSLAAELSAEFNGKLPMSFSGGADYFNIRSLVQAGIWPVTVATTLLKSGGYGRLKQLAEVTADCALEQNYVDPKLLGELAAQSFEDIHHVKKLQTQSRKLQPKEIPLFDCDMAPCQESCPIGQDITPYVELTAQGKYEEALEIILEKNPLPFITGTICPHRCQSNCSRNFYDSSVEIRQAKLLSAKNAGEKALSKLENPKTRSEKIAVIGGGPAGMAISHFLGRAGCAVTIFEKEESLGGVVEQIIPSFRIPRDVIEKDLAFLEKLGTKIKTGCEVKDLAPLKAEGYTHVILAVGAYGKGSMNLQGDRPVNALDFLRDCKANALTEPVGNNVVVIGGGNTAMDTARVALQQEGVSNVSIVYRRTISSMPAEPEEVMEAEEDGVEIRELLAPVKWEEGILTCEIMEKGELDSSGRPSLVNTGKFQTVLADKLILAVGEQVEGSFYEKLGLALTEKGIAKLDDNYESSLEKVYVIGDGRQGPATVVQGIADARVVADQILNKKAFVSYPTTAAEEFKKRRGVLDQEGKNPCLGCGVRCQTCIEVCPNRANLAIQVDGKEQILHYDPMCNECGNCATFCPYHGRPYLEKFTYFATEEAFAESKNSGWFFVDKTTGKVRIKGEVSTISIHDKGEVAELLKAVMENYAYIT
ncbi:MAG: putative selenate reductase subunit YgfK [Eubacteriales bacterium]